MLPVGLPIGARAAQPFATLTTVDATEIAGRPVQLDTQGKLLPWPQADDTGYSYSAHVLSQWAILQDQFQRQRLPYFYCCVDFDRSTFELVPDRKWVNSTAYLRGMLEGFVERLYPYTGDERPLRYLQDFVDYEMAHGLTPAGYAWSRVPYPSANPGDADYRGWSRHGDDYVEPHLVGEDGYAYVRLYEMTGQAKYLQAAIHFADQLVRNYRPGNAERSPWPVRCHARDGRVEGPGMGPYSANVLGPISLFDELLRIHEGRLADYRRIRQAAWHWLEQYPLQDNVWVGYFEDVAPSMGNMNNVIPLELARYVLLHPDKDPHWREHAAALIEWVKTTPRWPKYLVHGAMVTTEQGDGRTFCCNEPNQCCESHTARLAAVEALYYSRTRDPRYREQAFRSFNWVTYFQGLPGSAHAPYSDQWWFTDEFTDGPRRVMDAFWAVPEWAPDDESHLLGSSSPVTRIAYARGKVSYSTFDADSEDVLRLDFEPISISAGGRLLPPRIEPGPVEGYSFNPGTRVLRIHHRRSGDIVITGAGGQPPLRYVTFDDPHLAAGTVLAGEYPAGLVRWTDGDWQIGVPAGRFGTFNLVRHGAAPALSFAFVTAQVFAGVDVHNPADRATTLSVRCSPAQRIEVTIGPDQLLRIRTGWREPCTNVVVEYPPDAPLRFDNLAYTPTP
ncbi:MAG: hypothetical protein KGL25_13750 [Gammaproteobacteria bacterium]|nr:hypothetical protein [Gammaproteobacteria bacterium]